MANWVKWWKSKFAWTIIGLVALAMVLSFLSAYFIVDPWGLIGVFLICLPTGYILRRMVIKKIDEFVNKL